MDPFEAQYGKIVSINLKQREEEKTILWHVTAERKKKMEEF